MDNKSSTSSSTRDVQGQPVAKKSRLVCKTIIYDKSVANQWLDEPPLEIWDHHIIPLLGLEKFSFDTHFILHKSVATNSTHPSPTTTPSIPSNNAFGHVSPP